MSLCMSSLNEAYERETHPWEKKENPQRYDNLAVTLINPDPKRHILGIVGGNEQNVARYDILDELEKLKDK